MVAFDTVKRARRPEAAGFPAQQPADTATAPADSFATAVVTLA